MRVSERYIVPFRWGTPLLPPSSMAGKETIVLAKEDWPNATKTRTAKSPICNKKFPRRWRVPRYQMPGPRHSKGEVRGVSGVHGIFCCKSFVESYRFTPGAACDTRRCKTRCLFRLPWETPS
jgi:hypothetical protein